MKQRFHFSKAEKVGVAVLSLIIVLLLVVLNLPKHTFVEDIFLKDSTQVAFVDLRNKKSDSFNKVKVEIKKIINPFNPNHLSAADWQELGFSQKQAKVIINFKNKIGGFKSEKDVAECYVIDDKKFRELKPYLLFNEPIVEEKPAQRMAEEKKRVEMNGATVSDLESVKGIGPYFAKQIIELRDKFGGFYSVNQIKEIYGMTEEKFVEISPQVLVDPSLIDHIQIGAAKFNDLKKHPYLNWKQSQVIATLNTNKADSSFWSALHESEQFSEKEINRLKPYLK